MPKNCLIIKEKTRFFSFNTELVKEKDFLLLKTNKENIFTAKRILKILEKHKILNLAFENDFSKDFIMFFKGKINILEKDKILFANIDSILKKLLISYGIKDGALNLGIISGYKCEALLKLIKSLSLKLKTLHFYSSNKEDLKYPGEFYMETGIPVIIKSTPDFTGCEILLYLSYDKITFSNFKGKLIDIFDVTGSKGIKDIKASVKNPYNISDAVFLRLINKPIKIHSFK